MTGRGEADEIARTIVSLLSKDSYCSKCFQQKQTLTLYNLCVPCDHQETLKRTCFWLIFVLILYCETIWVQFLIDLWDWHVSFSEWCFFNYVFIIEGLVLFVVLFTKWNDKAPEGVLLALFLVCFLHLSVLLVTIPIVMLAQHTTVCQLIVSFLLQLYQRLRIVFWGIGLFQLGLNLHRYWICHTSTPFSRTMKWWNPIPKYRLIGSFILWITIISMDIGLKFTLDWTRWSLPCIKNMIYPTQAFTICFAASSLTLIPSWCAEGGKTAVLFFSFVAMVFGSLSSLFSGLVFLSKEPLVLAMIQWCKQYHLLVQGILILPSTWHLVHCLRKNFLLTRNC